MLFDNHDGLSFSARRIALRADGSYADMHYTDVVGHERVKRGVYSLDAEKTHLPLSPKGGQTEHLYHVD